MSDNQHEESHPAPRYWLILVALVALTAIEVGASYLTGGIKLGVLIALAIAKAALVVMYFMHLKFDTRLYTVMFLLGLVLIAPLLIFLIVATP